MRWLITLTAGQARRPKAVTTAILPSMRVGRALHRLALDVADEVASIVDPSDSTEAQLTILGYVLGAADAGRLLAAAGHVRAAQAQIRSVIEGFALIECLQGNDARAEEWRNASTAAERRKFDYGRLKECSDNARQLQSAWDSLNEYVHTNRTALPTHSRMRAVFGYDIPISSVYDLFPMVTSLALINGLEFLVLEWVTKHVMSSAPKRLLERMARIGGRTTEVSKARANLPVLEPAKDGLSTAEQRRALAHISRQARRAGRRDVARWVIARSKAPRTS